MPSLAKIPSAMVMRFLSGSRLDSCWNGCGLGIEHTTCHRARASKKSGFNLDHYRQVATLVTSAPIVYSTSVDSELSLPAFE